MRRSSRVSVAIAVRVRSLEGSVPYAEKCQTLVVNANGCGFRSPRPLPAGTRVEVEVISSKRRGNGRAVNCVALPPNSWLIGVQLDVPGNIWGLHPVPADWPADPSSQPGGSGESVATPGANAAGLSYSPFASSRPPAEHRPPVVAAAAAPSTPLSPAEEKAWQASLENHAQQLTAGLTREAERSMAALRQFVEECTRRNAEGLTSVLAESRTEISRCAEAASQDAAAGLQQRMQAEFERELQQLREAGEVLQGQTQQVEQERHALAAEIEAVRNEREQLEAMLRQIPETLQAQAEGRAAALLEQIRARLQKDAAAIIDERLHGARTDLHKAAEDVQQQMEQTASASFQGRSEAMQAAYDSALQELQQLHAQTKDLVSSVHSELHAQVTEAVREALQEGVKQGREELAQSAAAARDAQMAQVQSEVDRLLADTVGRGEQAALQAQETVAKLEQQRQAALEAVDTVKRTQQELSQAAAAAGETQVARIRAEVDRLLADAVGRGEQAARQLHELLAAFEQQRRTADTAVQEIVKRAQEELSHSAAESRQAQVAQVQAELDRVLADAVVRGEQAARQLQELMEGLRQQNQAGEAHSATLREQMERARTWLTEETRRFKEQVHDAFVEAGGEIRGRMHSAIEAADAPIRRRAQQLQAQIEQAATNQRTELQREVEEARALLLAAAAETEKSSDDLLKQRLSQTLQIFQQDADKLARASLERWQSAWQESCRVFPEALQRALNKEK